MKLSLLFGGKRKREEFEATRKEIAKSKHSALTTDPHFIKSVQDGSFKGIAVTDAEVQAVLKKKKDDQKAAKLKAQCSCGAQQMTMTPSAAAAMAAESAAGQVAPPTPAGPVIDTTSESYKQQQLRNKGPAKTSSAVPLDQALSKRVTDFANEPVKAPAPAKTTAPKKTPAKK